MSSVNHHTLRFHCTTCNKILSSKQNLKQHQNIHTGQRPYQCNFPGCQSAFKYASQLSNHKMLHKAPVKSLKDLFCDFRAFIMLLLEMFDTQESLIRNGQKKSFSREKIILPLITSEKQEAKIPLAERLKCLNN